jgi:glycosyltransferase involved in cell wall biosynthesis
VNTRIVLFDLYTGGHHPRYLEYLTVYWAERRLEGELHVVVSDRHVREHAETAERLAATPKTEVHVARLPSDFDDAQSGKVARDRLHRGLADHYVRKLRPDHFMFMYLDHAQLSLALGLRFPWPLAISGIYFRPTFHYGSLGGGRRSQTDRVQGAVKRLVLRAALRNPHVRTVFSLDPFVVPYINGWSQRAEAVALPDPFDDVQTRKDIALLDAVEPHRRKLLIVGVLDEKKGTAIVLDALLGLPRHAQRKLALIVAGPVVGPGRAQLLARLEHFVSESDVQLLLEDSYIPEEDVQGLLRACHLSLLTYQRQHVGSSAVMIRSAAAGIPVLATDYGAVGEQVRQHRLGLVVDTTDADTIRRALEMWLERPEAIPFDGEAAAAFARQNTAELFAATIFNGLLPSYVDPALDARRAAGRA